MEADGTWHYSYHIQRTTQPAYTRVDSRGSYIETKTQKKARIQNAALCSTTVTSKLRNTSLHREGSRAPTMRGGLWTCLSSGTSSPTEGAGHRAPVTLRTKSEALRHRTSAGLGAGQRHRPRLGAGLGRPSPTEGAGHRAPVALRTKSEALRHRTKSDDKSGVPRSSIL